MKKKTKEKLEIALIQLILSFLLLALIAVIKAEFDRNYVIILIIALTSAVILLMWKLFRS